ncbi:MAG: hypothetical protein ACLP01_32370 [Solirubrobacteraceae bacterium]
MPRVDPSGGEVLCGFPAKRARIVGGHAAGAASAAYACNGSQITLFDNWNGGAVSGGGGTPSFSTNGRVYCVDSISTYH